MAAFSWAFMALPGWLPALLMDGGAAAAGLGGAAAAPAPSPSPKISCALAMQRATQPTTPLLFMGFMKLESSSLPRIRVGPNTMPRLLGAILFTSECCDTSNRNSISSLMIVWFACGSWPSSSFTFAGLSGSGSAMALRNLSWCSKVKSGVGSSRKNFFSAPDTALQSMCSRSGEEFGWKNSLPSLFRSEAVPDTRNSPCSLSEVLRSTSIHCVTIGGMGWPYLVMTVSRGMP
mmetsp:Transcript_10086/g.41102  ORF Transcript_10086/g.41102 Transcript_10086/m.41102 type:complete len:233 (-) Transcript_10086:815-1513(-)